MPNAESGTSLNWSWSVHDGIVGRAAGVGAASDDRDVCGHAQHGDLRGQRPCQPGPMIAKSPPLPWTVREPGA
jgi:hypothetical protein